MDQPEVVLGDAENKGSDSIPQRWFDENRQIFGAQSTGVDIKTDRCPHQGFLFRTSNNEVECSSCHAGWMFPLSVTIVDGKIA